MASRKPSKRTFVEFLDGNDDNSGKVYRFQILLPNGTSTRLILRDPEEEMFIDEFIHAIRKELEKPSKTMDGSKRNILWNEDIYLEDMRDNKFRKKIQFGCFKPNKCYILRLHDGAGESVNTFQNMWDLTPDTELLAELPEEYTFETALADLIDNSLQAVWSNGPGERRLISVSIDERKIVIFDSGPGMDGSDDNSISKWGKIGSSIHRLSRKVAIGGEAPYLMPFFGMFGYGGPIASMHLGRRAVVSSKTKSSRKVYTLHLSREALLKKSTPNCVWRTDGGIRDPTKMEIQTSIHGSFTEVEIHDLKNNSLNTYDLQCFLKDIYFPYIQCDEELMSRKTAMPIEFEVNGVNLAEIEGGEVAVTNLHSCNGPEFIVQLSFSINQVNATSKSPEKEVCRKANARLRFVYFPAIEGKENIDRILEKLRGNGYTEHDNFENFSRVSIRRLGRLLPDARWGSIPFMDPKQRKGDKGQLLRRCCRRVKCFVETDAGFSPTPSKTYLAHHDPFTEALRNFGSRCYRKESEVDIATYKDGKSVTAVQLEREYHDWILQMHNRYDEEIDSGEDEPVIVIGPQNKKKLGVSSDVIRVHQSIRRKGCLWKSGQKVKILKGAIGCSKNNLYATLEFILLEGIQGDGGEARIICRPISCPDEKGSSIVMNNGTASLNIHDSLSFPISVIDSGKVQLIDHDLWNCQLEKRKLKAPSTIEILTCKQCRQLECDGGLPSEVDAGGRTPSEIIAVVRPASFSSSTSSNSLDQKYILNSDLEMSMEVKRLCQGKDCQDAVIYSKRFVKPTSRNGIRGLYIFSLHKANLFCKAGVYSFDFSVVCKDLICKVNVKVTVNPGSIIRSLCFLCDERGPLSVNSSLLCRVGSCISHLSVACLDLYSNRIPFTTLPDAKIKIYVEELKLVQVDKLKMALSRDKLTLEIMDILVDSNNLDKIRPKFEAELKFELLDGARSAVIPCKVMPGPLSTVKIRPSSERERHVLPGYVIQDILLEMLDDYGNHVEEGVEVLINVDGLCFDDNSGPVRKVDELGHINLGGILKVTASYGSMACLYVLVGTEMLFKENFLVEKRELKAVSGVPGYCTAGSMLDNVVFEVFDPEGLVDENIDGAYHTLTITSESLKMDGIRYTFEHGRCHVRDLPVPREPGIFRVLASHTHFPDLQTSFEIFVEQAPKLEIVAVENPEGGIYQSSSSDTRISFLHDTAPATPTQMNLLVESMIDDARILDEDIAEVGLRIRDHESKLNVLHDQKSYIVNEIYGLQALMEPAYSTHIETLIRAKECVHNKIEEKGNTAAAVFCNLSKAIKKQEPEEHFIQNIIGIVALLGTVSDVSLSRILAEYLGEEYMLAIVCKSYETASALEKYGEGGKVDRNCALHEVATALNIRISGRFSVVCLEEIRPFQGTLIPNDPQRKLSLERPQLPGKEAPAGFLGYAVNMINIDIHHLNTRTNLGYGLRETLFYRLFGEIQVYQTREDMKRASAFIKHGAVSLDGGLMRENGIILLGSLEPAVQFPVLAPQFRKLSPHTIGILKEIEKNKTLLEALDEEMRKEAEAHLKALAKFKKKSEKLRKFNSSLGYHLEYKPMRDSI